MAIAWLGLALTAQVMPSRFRRYDLLWLLPDWKFFAPNPPCSDIRLFVRLEKNPDTWREIGERESLTLRKVLFRAGFSPNRRIYKQLSEFASLLKEPGVHTSTVLGSSDYLSVSFLAEAAAVQSGQRCLQFMVAETDALSGSFEILFASEFKDR